MKFISVITVIIFFALSIVPLCFINTTPDVVSPIDNRKLAQSPFDSELKDSEDRDFPRDFDAYVEDRIGFRDDMILSDMLINDGLFGILNHPNYRYGKDGYVFFRNIMNIDYNEYHQIFVFMVSKLQQYCSSRDIPFLFVFNPEKKAIYEEYMPDGATYNREWTDCLFDDLEHLGVNCINNTGILKEKAEAGEQVFNQKYNAGHWNDLGAFYGVNNILSNLQQFFPEIELNQKEDFDIQSETYTNLPLSRFPISEEEEIFTPKADIISLKSEYDCEVIRHEQYPEFDYFINKDKIDGDYPRVLCFQGSYMNGMGYKFMQNAFGEYIYVHNYQNVLNMPYYINLFRPDCVIFETAEYTFLPQYFDLNTMENISFNSPISSYNPDEDTYNHKCLNPDMMNFDFADDKFKRIEWNSDDEYSHAWFVADMEYDMKQSDDSPYVFETTIPMEVYNEYKDTFYIAAETNSDITIFSQEIPETETEEAGSGSSQKL